MFNECLWAKDMLAVLDKFLARFNVSNMVNFQKCFSNKLIKWFAFSSFKMLAARILLGLKHCCLCFKLYIKIAMPSQFTFSDFLIF